MTDDQIARERVKKNAEANAVTDAQIIAAIRDGARTERVADRLGLLLSRRIIYRRLRALEDRRIIRRHPRYSFINSIYWEASIAASQGAPTPTDIGLETVGEG